MDSYHGHYLVIINFAPNLLQPNTQDTSEDLDDNCLVIQACSMEPVFKVGDVVRIDREISIQEIHVGTEYDEPPGDILAYQGATQVIVHRAIDKKTGTDGKFVFVMHGDANGEGANEHVQCIRS